MLLKKEIDFLSVTLITLTLIGCGKSFNDNSNKHLNELVEVTIKEKQDIGQYSVEFRSSSDSRFSVIKHDLLKGESSELVVGMKGFFEDENVISGHVYKYDIGEYVNDKSFSLIMEKEIKIPLDIKIDESRQLILDPKDSIQSNEGHNIYKINRLALDRNSVLLTNGQKVNLKINKLLSFNGKIATFLENSKAEKGFDGLNGNEILIDIETANGNLVLELRGQNGGDALRPASLGEAGRGPSGTKGSVEGQAVIDHYMGVQGSYHNIKEDCLVNSSVGETGGKGQMGLKGNRGHKGGDTGAAIINITSSVNFNLDYRLIEGEGGEGSIGGEGGIGGLGGEPAREKVVESYIDEDIQGGPSETYFNNIPEICSARFGATGPIGDDGPMGEKGVKGIIQSLCFKKNKNDKLECSKN